MYDVPNSSEIKDVLRHKDQMLCRLYTQRKRIYGRMRREKAFTFSSLSLFADQEAIEEKRPFYTKHLKNIFKEEMRIFEIWHCFSCLPEPYHTCLDQRYVQQHFSCQPFSINKAQPLTRNFIYQCDKGIELIQTLFKKKYHENFVQDGSHRLS